MRTLLEVQFLCAPLQEQSKWYRAGNIWTELWIVNTTSVIEVDNATLRAMFIATCKLATFST